jgi:membrane-associated phospholipid phosphatase
MKHPAHDEVHTWDRGLASIISLVLSPPMLTVASMAIRAGTLSGRHLWIWVVVYAVVGMLLPLTYLYRQVRREFVSDFDLRVRTERLKPQLVTAASGCIAWGILFLGRAPGPMINLAATLFLLSVAILSITLRWKISMHGAVAGAAGTVVGMVLGAWWPLIGCLVLVGWSRLRLHRHTPAQVVAGSILGIGMVRLASDLI